MQNVASDVGQVSTGSASGGPDPLQQAGARRARPAAVRARSSKPGLDGLDQRRSGPAPASPGSTGSTAGREKADAAPLGGKERRPLDPVLLGWKDGAKSGAAASGRGACGGP
ncbi:hypothetical protein GCM10027273_17550 [Nocardioides pakistanensis]